MHLLALLHNLKRFTSGKANSTSVRGVQKAYAIAQVFILTLYHNTKLNPPRRVTVDAMENKTLHHGEAITDVPVTK